MERCLKYVLSFQLITFKIVISPHNNSCTYHNIGKCLGCLLLELGFQGQMRSHCALSVESEVGKWDYPLWTRERLVNENYWLVQYAEMTQHRHERVHFSINTRMDTSQREMKTRRLVAIDELVKIKNKKCQRFWNMKSQHNPTKFVISNKFNLKVNKRLRIFKH